MIIPVPLHKNKLKKRGFNQVEKIFKPWIDKHHLIIAIFLSVQNKLNHNINYYAMNVKKI